MEKKQKKEYIQIIVYSVLIVVFAISAIFTNMIDKGIRNLLFNADIRASKDDLVVHFVDVGQGDAIALTFPNQQTMLIDTGTKDSQNYVVQYIKDNVLNSGNDLTIDYLILTHSDIDHSGGVSAILGEFEVKNFYRPNIASDSENFSEFALKSTLDEYDEAIKLSKLESGLQTYVINQNYEFKIGDSLVEIFAPVKVYDTPNEMSPLIKISYLGKSFLFTGDIEGEGETDMVEKYGNKLNADVLKVAHHGSSTSTTKEFVDIVTPKYAVISVGNNIYGHPTFEVVETLKSTGAKVLTTKQNSVRIVCGKDMFGVLNSKKIHSFEFVNWWIIVLCISLVFGGLLTKSIIVLVKLKNNDKFNKIKNS